MNSLELIWIRRNYYGILKSSLGLLGDCWGITSGLPWIFHRGCPHPPDPPPLFGVFVAISEQKVQCSRLHIHKHGSVSTTFSSFGIRPTVVLLPELTNYLFLHWCTKSTSVSSSRSQNTREKRTRWEGPHHFLVQQVLQSSTRPAGVEANTCLAVLHTKNSLKSYGPSCTSRI